MNIINSTESGISGRPSQVTISNGGCVGHNWLPETSIRFASAISGLRCLPLCHLYSHKLKTQSWSTFSAKK